MLIKLPGGHFVDPKTVAAVVTEEEGPGRNHVQCLLTTGVVCESPPVGTPRTARRMMRETVAAINAVLSPEDVEPDEEALHEYNTIMGALMSCRAVRGRLPECLGGVGASLDEAIRLLESKRQQSNKPEA